MLVRLSSKGQLVIPAAIRQALGLRAGDRLQVRLAENKIVLEPEPISPIVALYGKYSDDKLVAALEAEHQQEMSDEATIRA